MYYFLALVLFLGATLFWIGFHNVDLIFNGCLWADMNGIDCVDLKDKNAFVLWSFPDGYANGVSLMIVSFIGTVSFVYLFLTHRVRVLERQLKKV